VSELKIHRDYVLKFDEKFHQLYLRGQYEQQHRLNVLDYVITCDELLLLFRDHHLRNIEN